MRLGFRIPLSVSHAAKAKKKRNEIRVNVLGLGLYRSAANGLNIANGLHKT